MTRNTRRYRYSKTPDISLPGLKNIDWATDIKTILCIDESLNDSGAALFYNGSYVPQKDENGKDIGFSFKQSLSKAKHEKVGAYFKWVNLMLQTAKPDVVVGESHPFARGNRFTSIATLETLIGIRYVTMLACDIAKIPYVEFSTNDVKMIICGSGSATKEMVQLVLQGCGYKLPVYENKDEINGNVCDAIAMGEVIVRMQKQEIIRKELAPIIGDGRTQTKSRRSRNEPKRERLQ